MNYTYLNHKLVGGLKLEVIDYWEAEWHQFGLCDTQYWAIGQAKHDQTE